MMPVSCSASFTYRQKGFLLIENPRELAYEIIATKSIIIKELRARINCILLEFIRCIFNEGNLNLFLKS